MQSVLDPDKIILVDLAQIKITVREHGVFYKVIIFLAESLRSARFFQPDQKSRRWILALRSSSTVLARCIPTVWMTVKMCWLTGVFPRLRSTSSVCEGPGYWQLIDQYCTCKTEYRTFLPTGCIYPGYIK